MNEPPSAPRDSAGHSRRARWLWRGSGALLWIAVLVAGFVILQNLQRRSAEPPEKSFSTGRHDAQKGIPAEPSGSPYPREIADFSLTERSGKTVTKADLLGHPWVASFLFTRCAGPCPKIAGQLKLLQEHFKDSDVRFVTFTVDPDYDTPERLTHYAEAIGADPNRWLFLTGDKQAIYDLIAVSFRMPVGTMQGEIIHSTNLMHVNSAGQVIGKYNGLDDGEVAALKRALDGREPRLRKQVSLAPDSTAPEWVALLPAVNASLNTLATMLLAAGYIFIRQKRITLHKVTMLLAFAVSILFLCTYLGYHFSLKHYTGTGSKPFPGTGPIRTAYFSILASHVTLAAIVPVLASVTIYRALNQQWQRHKRIAKVTYPIWLYVSVTGVIIYLMLYRWSAWTSR